MYILHTHPHASQLLWRSQEVVLQVPPPARLFSGSAQRQRNLLQTRTSPDSDLVNRTS